jgi:hypothetical protein
MPLNAVSNSIRWIKQECNMKISNFSNTYNGPHSIGFYFFIDSKKSKALLLYSWILPNRKNGSGWFKRKIDKNHVVLFGSFEANEILKLFDELLQDRTLDISSLNAGIEINIDKINEIKNWKLDSVKYVYRPKCIYQSKEEFNVVQDLFYAPSKRSIAKVESLFCVNKSEHLQLNDFLDHIDILKKETGIDFLRNQTGRLGNIEWYDFSSGTIHDKSFISGNAEKNISHKTISCKKIIVTLTTMVQGHFLVNVRCTNGRAIICDITKEVKVSTENISIEFDASEEISTHKVMVWKKKSKLWELCYEKEHTLIRQISIDMSIHKGKGIIESENLQKAQKIKPLFARAHALQKVSLYGKASNSHIDNINPADIDVKNHPA